MKRCNKCGGENNDQAKFCKFCGTNIESHEETFNTDSLYKENISVKTKNVPKYNNVNNGKYISLICAMIGIALVVFIMVKFIPFSHGNDVVTNELNVSNQETQNTQQVQEMTISPSTQQEQIKTKYDVLNEVALAAKNFYLSYLNASNNKDKYLMENCTEKLRDERGEYMKVNEDYEFYNRKFIFDIGSLEYITEDGQEKAIFKVRTENDGYRYNDGSYVDNIRCLHIEAIKENGEWQMDFVNKIDPSLLSENVFEVE